MPEAWMEGLSYKIPAAEADFNQKMIVGEFSENFLTYLKRKWAVSIVKVLPLIVRNDVEGILVSSQDISAEVAEHP